MTLVRQFQACETIVQTATVKGDEDILRVTGAVNNDLVAAEARYHKACHATYISKHNLHYEGRLVARARTEKVACSFACQRRSSLMKLSKVP